MLIQIKILCERRYYARSYDCVFAREWWVPSWSINHPVVIAFSYTEMRCVCAMDNRRRRTGLRKKRTRTLLVNAVTEPSRPIIIRPRSKTANWHHLNDQKTSRVWHSSVRNPGQNNRSKRSTLLLRSVIWFFVIPTANWKNVLEFSTIGFIRRPTKIGSWTFVAKLQPPHSNDATNSRYADDSG